jgi:heme-degrading monooxygenase HmoA
MDTPYFLIRHKVADFDHWEAIYAQHAVARLEAGFHELRRFRNMENPNEVIILFEVEDIDKAKAFMASDEVREKMQAAKVLDTPDAYFLT